MNHIEIDRDRCKACRLCIDVCHRHILDLAEELNAKGYHPIAALHNPEECTACALCGMVCPEGSIAIYKIAKPKKAG